MFFTDQCNIHRGIHMLAEEATAKYEERAKVARFIRERHRRQIIFTLQYTEASTLWLTAGAGQY
jgi:cysteine desulfurase/selenocysteine lyase